MDGKKGLHIALTPVAWSHGASVTVVIRNYRAVANVTMHILVPGSGGKIGWGIAQYFSYLQLKKNIYFTLKQESSIPV